ncbi:hypothetical protein [Spiroplasma endosymbiont of Polydrusus pterygomalis]|uniref:hypothetical protein n=1 Tax=Spiroplasma endosymbiont of Polydrusus pterygomalis TaxID=3139327 RepID=UPI003CCB6AF7
MLTKYISHIHWTLDFWYFDLDLREKIINNYNLFIKHSNQKQKQQIINNNFKSNNKKREYENWKQKYLKNINEKIMKNSIEQGIDALEYFKNEINWNDFQNSQPATSWYKSILPKI